MPKVNKTPQNPLKFAVSAWNTAIQRVDRHAIQCKRCNARKHPHKLAVSMGALLEPKLEAYQLCRKAKELYAAERAAIAAYLAQGGKLPTLQ